MESNYHIHNTYTNEPLRIGDVYLVQIGRLFCSPGQTLATHLHLNWFELTIVNGGRGTITTNDVEVPVKEGDIYLSFPSDMHKLVSSESDPMKYDFFSFYTSNEAYNADLETILTQFRDPGARVFSNERIKNLVAAGIAEFRRDEKKLHSDALLSAVFHQIIIYLIRTFRDHSETPTVNADKAEILCYQIMNYIDTHIFGLGSLRCLEQVTNYNYSYLSNLFAKTTGMTLLSYYQGARLKKARFLIRENKLKIGEIAELLGYSSVYVFSRAYKNKYGLAPTADREIDVR